ncbi:MAG: malonyl-CoA decarboxylase family protein, partial [Pseudomonadota bacterium]
MRPTFVQTLLNSIADAGRELLDLGGGSQRDTLETLCRALLSQRGEASGTALAREVLDAYLAAGEAERGAFFDLLEAEFGPDHGSLKIAAQSYLDMPDAQNLIKLSKAVEPPRQELFRRMNMAPDGTSALVEMRRQLLSTLRDHPERKAVDSDLRHLLSSWFNRGFLVLERIDWRTPAVVLEKLIAYEAVHEIQGWDDLRRRLADDRRCFAFFHPALRDEPLIFVEVALVKGLADAVQPLLDRTNPPDDPNNADTAIF